MWPPSLYQRELGQKLDSEDNEKSAYRRRCNGDALVHGECLWALQ